MSNHAIVRTCENMKETKTCTKCSKTLPLESFGSRKGKNRKPGDRHAECKSCTALRRRLRYKHEVGFAEKARQLANASYQRQRQSVLDHYGAVCSCCSESNVKFLTFDHINGRSKEHSRQAGDMSGKKLVCWIVKNNYPKDIQVLCFNCNCAKGFYKICPHKEQSQDVDRNDLRQQILWDLEAA